jgi:activator of 2-hydroxyglutaryl-CoA dehydratase
MKTYRAGIDIGSTTAKLVIIDEENKIIFGEYRRHRAQIREVQNYNMIYPIPVRAR